MKNYEIVITVDTRYANKAIIKKVEKFFNKIKNKQAKVIYRSLEHNTTQHLNYFTFIVESEMNSSDTSDYMIGTIKNVLSSLGLIPELDSNKLIFESVDTKDFDKEDFIEKINESFESNTNSRLINFHLYTGSTYVVSSETYSNIFENDDIYIDINYENIISKEELILTIDFDTNGNSNIIKYIVNDYNPYEVAEKLNELYEDLLLHYYKEQKDYLVKFDKEDLLFLSNKFPEDGLLKSLMSGNKYKLFESFEILNKKDFNEYKFEKDINSILKSNGNNRLSNFKYLGRNTYTIDSKTHNNIHNTNIDIEIKVEDALSDNILLVYITLVSYFEKIPNRDTIDIDGFNLQKIVDVIFKLYDYEIIELYKVNNNNKSFLKKFSNEDLLFLSNKFPEDNLLKSLLSGDKYKLFDNFNFEDHPKRRSVKEINKYLDKKIIDKFGYTYIEQDFIFVENKDFGNFRHLGYGDGAISSELFGELIYIDDYNKVIVDLFKSYIEIDNTAKDIAETINFIINKIYLDLYKEDKTNLIHFRESVIKDLVKGITDIEIENLLKSYRGGKKYKLFEDFNKEDILYPLVEIKKYLDKNIYDSFEYLWSEDENVFIIENKEFTTIGESLWENNQRDLDIRIKHIRNNEIEIEMIINSNHIYSNEISKDEENIYKTIAEIINSLMIDVYCFLYETNKKDIYHFRQYFQNIIKEEFPEDKELIKSYMTGSKYKLFDSFITEKTLYSDLIEFVDKNLFDYIEEEMYDDNIYFIRCDLDKIYKDDPLMIEILYNSYNEAEIFIGNSDLYDNDVVNNDIDEIAECLNKMMIELYKKSYKQDKMNIKYFNKHVMEILSNEFPDDKILLKSLKTSVKYKLFDSYNIIQPKLPL